MFQGPWHVSAIPKSDSLIHNLRVHVHDTAIHALQVSKDTDTSGKPHPLESVSRQLDPIDIDDGDDWGLQEVRAATDAISETCDTANMTTNIHNDTGDTFDSKRDSEDQEKEKDTEKLDAVDGK